MMQQLTMCHLHIGQLFQRTPNHPTKQKHIHIYISVHGCDASKGESYKRYQAAIPAPISCSETMALPNEASLLRTVTRDSDVISAIDSSSILL